jgi:hypothetical protein
MVGAEPPQLTLELVDLLVECLAASGRYQK